MQNFLGEGRALIANKRSIVGTIGGDGEPTCRFVQVASVVAANTFPAGVLGHYFVFGQKPLITLPGKPMRAVFKEADDAAIIAFKQTGNTTYLYGMTVPKLLEWSPPKEATTNIDELGLLQTWKSTHADISELVPLEKSVTHDFKALAEKLMSHMPTFSAHKIRSPKDVEKWCDNTFMYNVKAVIDASEVDDRKRAKEKSVTARDASGTESAALGLAAKKLWSDRKQSLAAAAPFYDDEFQDRFIVIELDGTTGQPTESAIEQVRLELKCVPCPLALTTALPPSCSSHARCASRAASRAAVARRSAADNCCQGRGCICCIFSSGRH